MGRLMLLVLGSLLAGCARAPSNDEPAPAPHVFTDRSLDAIVGHDGGMPTGTRALGAACGTSGRQDCASGICLKSQRERGRGYFCSRECDTQDDCPVDWLCRQVMPGPHGMLCTPPARWTAHAVGVRP